MNILRGASREKRCRREGARGSSRYGREGGRRRTMATAMRHISMVLQQEVHAGMLRGRCRRAMSALKIEGIYSMKKKSGR